MLLTGQDLYRIYMPVHGHDIGLSASAIGIVLSAFPAAAFSVRLILQRLVGPVVFGAIGSVFGLLSMFWFNALMMSAGGWLSRPETAKRAGPNR